MTAARLRGGCRANVPALCVRGRWWQRGAAPPARRVAQWKDGYSAKEQAEAWLRSGTPRMPDELWGRLSDIVSGADEVFGRPEHKTRLDN